MLRRLLLSIASAAALAGSPTAHAQDYPTKPIRLVVPFAAGGALDTFARIFAPKLQQALGQPVLVENKPGAGSMLGTEMVARSPADGYTVLIPGSSLVIGPLLSPVNFDPIKDFAPVIQVAAAVNVLVVNAEFPVKSVQELIQYLKANPGKVSYGSAGSGTTPHLQGELLKSLAGVEMTHIPYKGSAPALIDLVAGRVQVMFDPLASAGPFIKSGKLRALAVTTAARSPSAPELPTVSEAGVPGFETTPWVGVVVPAGTPKPIVNRLNHEFANLLKAADVKERLQSMGFDIVVSTPGEFGKFIASDQAKWARVIKISGAKAD